MDDNKTRVIMEQGDMGLFQDPLSDEDQKKYDRYKEKEDKDNK